MDLQTIQNDYNNHIMPTYARFPVAIERGEGARLYDFDGMCYIDFTSGIGVNSIGYGNAAWQSAITEQASRLGHISNLFYTEPGAKLGARLCEASGMDKVFFSNSGAESNEGAIKLARKYGCDKYGGKRSKIITLINSFHGRTISTLAATGQDKFHNYFHPFTEGFLHIPANNTDALRAALTDDVCAVMLELVQGEGGVLPMDPEYVKAAEALCREKDLLLIIDEVQTGIGRTGSMFAFSQFGIAPDVVTFAKGIGGGLPLGGFLASKRCSEVLGSGTHATTFGGNPICCAAACAVLDVLDGGVLEQVVKKGEYIRGKIAAMENPLISGTRGMGLMIGVIIEGAAPADIASSLIKNGLLVLTAGRDALRFLPPLTITYTEIDEGLEIFERVLGNITRGDKG